MDCSEKSSPHAERGWQDEIWNPAVVRDEIPPEEEGECRDKNGDESFGHLCRSRRPRRRERRLEHELKAKRLVKISYGARNQTEAESNPKKIPKTNRVFGTYVESDSREP